MTTRRKARTRRGCRAGRKKAGWEALLNKRGTTFRTLPVADKSAIDEAKAIALMAAHPSLIKRPVVEHDGGLLVGFRCRTMGRSTRLILR